jgi:uncharacterized protein HemX
MDSNNETAGTEIVEEQETAPKKKGRWAGLSIGIGIALCVVVAGAMFYAFKQPQQSAYKPTAEEVEQQKLDQDESRREQQKADQIRDQSFLIRKGEDNQAQLNSLFKDLDFDKGQDSMRSLVTLPSQELSKMKRDLKSRPQTENRFPCLSILAISAGLLITTQPKIRSPSAIMPAQVKRSQRK